MSLVESQISEILEREAVRLPIEELKATGPGPESAYVITHGRRIRRNDWQTNEGSFYEEPRLTLIQRISSLIELVGEEVNYIRIRMGG